MQERLYKSIRQAIIDGSIRAGESVTEEFLSNRFKMSRTPVREVLTRLESEGLIKKVGRKGAFVREITPVDVSEIYELRIVLESYAAGVCAKVSDKEVAESIKAELDRAYHENHNLSDKIKPGLRLHRFVIDSTRNSRMQNVLELFDVQISRTRYLAGRIPGRVDKYLQDHIKIAEAICSGDKARAEKRMREHLESTMHDILDVSNFGYVFKDWRASDSLRRG